MPEAIARKVNRLAAAASLKASYVSERPNRVRPGNHHLFRGDVVAVWVLTAVPCLSWREVRTATHHACYTGAAADGKAAALEYPMARNRKPRTRSGVVCEGVLAIISSSTLESHPYAFSAALHRRHRCRVHHLRWLCQHGTALTVLRSDLHPWPRSTQAGADLR